MTFSKMPCVYGEVICSVNFILSFYQIHYIQTLSQWLEIDILDKWLHTRNYFQETWYRSIHDFIYRPHLFIKGCSQCKFSTDVMPVNLKKVRINK